MFLKVGSVGLDMIKKGSYTGKDVAKMIDDSYFYKENFEYNKATFERVKTSYEAGYTAKRTMIEVISSTYEDQSYILNIFRINIPENVRKWTSLENEIVDNLSKIISYRVNMPPERLIVQQMHEKLEKGNEGK